jgi:hypothetical protein
VQVPHRREEIIAEGREMCSCHLGEGIIAKGREIVQVPHIRRRNNR